MESWCRKIGTYQAKLELLAIEEEHPFDPGAGVGRVERHRADPADLRPRDPVRRPGRAGSAGAARRRRRARAPRPPYPSGRTSSAATSRTRRSRTARRRARRGGSRRRSRPSESATSPPQPGPKCARAKAASASVSATPARRTVTPSAASRVSAVRRRPQRGRVLVGQVRGHVPGGTVLLVAQRHRRAHGRRVAHVDARPGVAPAGCPRAAPRRRRARRARPRRGSSSARPMPRRRCRGCTATRSTWPMAGSRNAVEPSDRAHDSAVLDRDEAGGTAGRRARLAEPPDDLLRLGRVLRQVEGLAAQRDHGRQVIGVQLGDGELVIHVGDPSRPSGAACTAAKASTNPAP